MTALRFAITAVRDWPLSTAACEFVAALALLTSPGWLPALALEAMR